MAKTGYVWDGTQFVSISSPIAAVPNAVTSYNSIAPAVKTTRTNLVTNPSFEDSVGAWSIQGGFGSVNRSTVRSYLGTASALLDRAAGTGDNYAELSVSGLTSNVTYIFSAYIFLPTGYVISNTFQGRSIIWLVNYTGSVVVAETSPNVLLTNQWQRVSTTITLPNTSTSFNIRLNLPTGGGVYVDTMLLEVGSTLNPYFDGTNYSPITEAYPSSITTAWTGTANASTSTISYYKQSDVKIGQLWIDSSSMTIYVYTGANWAVAAAATAAIPSINLNSNVIAADYTMATGYNGTSAGPITINSGITVTIPTGSVWTVV